MIDLFLSHIYEHKPTQRKRINAFFAYVPAARNALEDFLTTYSSVWETPEIGGLEGLASAYTRLLDEITLCRIQFTRTGAYPHTSQNALMESVYNNTVHMQAYMLGLAVSQYLWPAHYQLLEFYKKCVDAHKSAKRFLEVGSGPGIFLNYLASKAAALATIDVVDISPISIELSQALLKASNPSVINRIRFIQSDITCYTTEESYDFIGMGEVLEHVESPSRILKILHGLLADEGSLYLSTCANCPAIDHIYLFHNIDEIRSLIHDSGFHIMEEVVALSEDRPLDYMEKQKLDILYGAWVRKR